MEKYLKKYYRLFFLAVAILLLYPTLQRGYIMLLDWMVLPNISFSDINWSIDSIGVVIFKLLSLILGFGIVQRIVLFAIIFFAGTAGFRMAKRTKNIFAQYFAGLFLIFNPFIYERAIEQPNIAGGTVLFFWFLVYFLEYLEDRQRKKLLLASILAAFSVSVFIHSVFFIALSVIIFLLFDFLKKKNWKFALQTGLTILCFIVVPNLNWLVSFANGTSQGIGGIRDFSLEDVATFDTSGINGGSVYPAVLALQGYWGEYQDRFVPFPENPLWSIAFLLIFALAVFGTFKLWKKDRFTKPLVILFWVAYVLAVGVASPLFKPIVLFLYQHVPLYIGLREPQKWVALLVFFYAFSGSWGIAYLLKNKKIKNYRAEIGIFCAILPIIFSFSAIRGMHEHFTTHEFPAEWQDAKNYLNENQTDGKILFLPWHSYMNFSFSGKNIVNPAQPFFGKNVIVGNNTEFRSVYSHFSDPQTLTIEKYVPDEKNPIKKISGTDFIPDMAKLGIKKVILDKDEDWKSYSWLDTINAQKVLENDKLIIYNL